MDENNYTEHCNNAMNKQRANVGDIFFFVTPDCRFEIRYDYRMTFENKLFKAGNYFLNAEDATRVAIRFKNMLADKPIDDADRTNKSNKTSSFNPLRKIFNRLGILNKVSPNTSDRISGLYLSNFHQCL